MVTEDFHVSREQKQRNNEQMTGTCTYTHHLLLLQYILYVHIKPLHQHRYLVLFLTQSFFDMDTWYFW